MKVLKFYAEWCSPCKGLSMVLNSVSDQLKLPVEEVDIDQNTDLARRMNIRGVPTMIVVDDEGNAVRQKVGVGTADEIVAFINQGV